MWHLAAGPLRALSRRFENRGFSLAQVKSGPAFSAALGQVQQPPRPEWDVGFLSQSGRRSIITLRLRV